MDEHETIPRREATLGVALLGVLTLALVGTVAFRIIQASPRHASPLSSSQWASSGTSSPELKSAIGDPFANEEQVAAENFPAVPTTAPIPTVADDVGIIPASATVDAHKAMPLLNSPPAPSDAPPFFVAPSGR